MTLAIIPDGPLPELAVAAAIAALLHVLWRRYLAAAVLAAVLSSTILAIDARLELGYWSPWASIAWIVGLAYCFVLALVVGVLVQALRRNKEETGGSFPVTPPATTEDSGKHQDEAGTQEDDGGSR